MWPIEADPIAWSIKFHRVATNAIKNECIGIKLYFKIRLWKKKRASCIGDRPCTLLRWNENECIECVSRYVAFFFGRGSSRTQTLRRIAVSRFGSQRTSDFLSMPHRRWNKASECDSWLWNPIHSNILSSNAFRFRSHVHWAYNYSGSFGVLYMAWYKNCVEKKETVLKSDILAWM